MTKIIIFVITNMLLIISSPIYGQTIIEACKQGTPLATEIRNNYTPSSTLSYDNARDVMYSVIDDDGSHQIYCAYTGFSVTRNPSQDPSISVYQGGAGLNAEHVYPQSKGASGSAQGDLHNLLTTNVYINGERGSCPFGELNDNTQTDDWYNLSGGSVVKTSAVPTTNIDAYSERKNGSNCVFEPREDMKGNVARAVFYFYTIYKTQADAADANFFNNMKADLIQWHYADPVDAAELARTNAIANYQTYENPFILDSTLARRIYFLPDATYPTGDPNCYNGSGGSGGTTGGTGGGVTSNASDSVLIIEIADPSNIYQARFVTIQNKSTQVIDISNWRMRRYGNGGTTPGETSFSASTTLQPNQKFIIAFNATSFFNAYNKNADLVMSSVIQGNGNDVYTLADANGDNLDVYGIIGEDGNNKNWDYENGFVQRNTSVFESTTTFDINEWTINSNQTTSDIIGKSVALPVELVRFDAKRVGEKIELNWQTNSEENNAFFEIERSQNGFDFAAIGKLSGAGTTIEIQNYTFVDEKPFTGTNYYRLRQVNFDESFEYSTIIAVQTSKKVAAVSIVQNPVFNQLQIEFANINKENLQVEIYNLSGQLMISDNLLTIENRQLINVASLGAGMYFIKMNIGNKIVTKRFIKN